MNDQTASAGAGDDCAAKLAEIEERQKEFDGLWLQMSAGNTTNAARYRELRHILDDSRAEYRKTCGELSETTSLPPHIVADWRS
jgi:hypothetical protein